MILKCSCYNKYQDELYGKGNRVYNYPCKNKNTGRYTDARCTVCDNMQDVGIVNEEAQKRE